MNKFFHVFSEYYNYLNNDKINLPLHTFYSYCLTQCNINTNMCILIINNKCKFAQEFSFLQYCVHKPTYVHLKLVFYVFVLNEYEILTKKNNNKKI